MRTRGRPTTVDEDPPIDPARQKLVDAKRQWAEEGRLITGKTGQRGRDRLPPGQHEVKNWPVLDLGVQPKVERWEWKLTIDGLVTKPIAWTFQDFLAQPQFQSLSDIHCVTAWSRFDNQCEGVSARHILSVVQPQARAKRLVSTRQYASTTN